MRPRTPIQLLAAQKVHRSAERCIIAAQGGPHLVRWRAACAQEQHGACYIVHGAPSNIFKREAEASKGVLCP
eukprot:5119156-Lingulodinium_polyedra.AAC.1